MSSPQEQNENVRLLVTTPLDTDVRKFHLVGIEGGEEISGLFHFKLILRTFDEAVDFSKILNNNIVVTVKRDQDPPRLINGLVAGFTQAWSDGRVTFYHAEIRPWLWKLTLTRNSRIFQNMTVPDILSKLFSDLGCTDFKDNTTKTYQQRIYCVQYQETAFDFASRLMEDEGIFYFFEHAKEAHTLVLADDSSAFEACPGGDPVQYREVEPHMDNLVQTFDYQEQMITTKYAVDDYNFEDPETDLLTEADSGQSGDLRVYEYPAGFTKTNDGETMANLRVDEKELPYKTVTGLGCCRAFTAGCKFTLKDHYRQDYNTDYVLRRLTLEITQDECRDEFEAFPADSVFTPPRLTPKPKIYGTQTALVTGKSGEEIWTDEYGRIKVKFHWDQSDEENENTSCWIRTAQVWAGKSWGTMFIPRLGTEVVVSFLNGDPDYPLVIGTVYNASQVLPYTQPDNKNRSTILTRSTKQGEAGNEVRFDDAKGSEELYFHAQKDMTVLVENDQNITITQNRNLTVSKADETLTVDQGDRSIAVNKGKETHTNAADFTHQVKGDYSLTVDGDLTIDVKGKVTFKSGDKMDINSGADLTIQAGSALTAKSGTDLTVQSGTGLTIKSGTDLTAKSGTDLTIQAGIQLSAKGSAGATLDGGAQTSVKGGIVQIN